MKNDKIVIQQVTETRSATSGGIVSTWATFATAWADVEQVSGNENFNADMIVYGDVKKFKIYYNHGKDVTPKMRIVYRDENYDITSIDHIKRLETVILAIRHDDE